MTPQIAEYLRAEGVVPGIGRKTSLSAIKMRNTSREGGTLVSLLFVDDAPSPNYVLRVPRNPARDARVATNYHALEAVREAEPLRDLAPQPIFMGRIAGVLTTLETYLDGASLAVVMRNAEVNGDEARFADLMSAAARALWRLHSATWVTDTRLPRSAFSNAGRADLDILTTTRLLNAAEASLYTAALQRLAAAVLPFARCHGDFNPNNLLVAEERQIMVIDWEYSTTGMALFDLFQLVTIGYLFPAAPEVRRVRMEALWTAGNPVGRAFLEILETYREVIQTPKEALQDAFSAYLGHMLADLQRLLGDGPEPMRDLWKVLLIQSLQRSRSAPGMKG